MTTSPVSDSFDSSNIGTTFLDEVPVLRCPSDQGSSLHVVYAGLEESEREGSVPIATLNY